MTLAALETIVPLANKLKQFVLKMQSVVQAKMQSLIQALTLPEVVVQMIQSYLNVGAYRNWRLTNKQAYQDVEDHVSKVMKNFQKRVVVIQFKIRPIRFDIATNKSNFLSFLSQTYRCEKCNAYEFPVNDTLEMVQLCEGCFDDDLDTETCSNCQHSFLPEEGDTCLECSDFYCEECSQEGIQYCVGCREPFCSVCGEGFFYEYCEDCYVHM